MTRSAGARSAGASAASSTRTRPPRRGEDGAPRPGRRPRCCPCRRRRRPGARRRRPSGRARRGRPPGPPGATSDRLVDVLEGRGVGRAHLVDAQDRLHGAASGSRPRWARPRPTTTAIATGSSSGDARGASRRPRGSRGQACRPGSEARAPGRPGRADHLDVAQTGYAHSPVPSAFITASLAAKRAARAADRVGGRRLAPLGSAEQPARRGAGGGARTPAEARRCRRRRCPPRRGPPADRRPGRRAHSTVTVLARLRGRSTSRPWRRAIR